MDNEASIKGAAAGKETYNFPHDVQVEGLATGFFFLSGNSFITIDHEKKKIEQTATFSDQDDRIKKEGERRRLKERKNGKMLRKKKKKLKNSHREQVI